MRSLCCFRAARFACVTFAFPLFAVFAGPDAAVAGDPKAAVPLPAKPGEPVPPNPWASGDPVRLKDALAALDHWKDVSGKAKSESNDLIVALDAVAAAYHRLAPDDEAGSTTFEADRAAFSKAAEKEFLDALELVHVKPNTRVNSREEVNVGAARILGTCRGKGMSARIIDALESRIFKAKEYDPPAPLYDAAFLALATLNDHKVGLAWCVGEWIKRPAVTGDVERVKAMYAALPRFRDVEGAVRRDVVLQTTRWFLPTEAWAERAKTEEDLTCKAVWDRIGPTVIKALQWATREPKAKDGALVASIHGFYDWVKEHVAARDSVWADSPPSGTSVRGG